MSTVFAKIIAGELPSDKVYENDHLIVINDINPEAPVHLLIIPKKEIKDIHSMVEEDLFLMQEIVKAGQKMAEKFDVLDGYRLVTNCGPAAGQTVFHLHFHLLGGKTMSQVS